MKIRFLNQVDKLKENVQWFHYVFIFLFCIFVFLHFYHLNIQEFIGDEASPMLNVDRMWDAINLHDIRFLAYPYLFYQDPYRSIFSGTLLHWFGPNRILLRIPSILFGLSLYWLLVWIFLQEKVKPWIIICAMATWVFSGIVINDRSGGGDAQTRFLIVFAGYFVWRAKNATSGRFFVYAVGSWLLGMVTMLDCVILVPALLFTGWNIRKKLHKKYILFVGAALGVLIIYFALWTFLPLLAYKSGIQHYLSNRGFFYYFNRAANQGVATDPLTSILALMKYTSFSFELWLACACFAGLFINKLRFVQLLTIPGWIVVLLLHKSSFHIIMYSGLFFLSAVLVTDFISKQFRYASFLCITLFLFLFLSNIVVFQKTYGNALLFTPHPTSHIIKNCQQDEAVKKIYNRHNQQMLNKNCQYPRIQ